MSTAKMVGGGDQLLHLQRAMRQMLEQPDLQVNLQAMVRTVRALGWHKVLLALFGPERAVQHVIAEGVSPAERAAWGAQPLPPALWNLLAERGLEPFRVGAVYYLPDAAAAGPEWSRGDIAFAVLQVGSGPVRGVLRLDEPSDGVRPAPPILHAVDILVGQAAYMVENARLIADLSQTAGALAEQVEELSMIHRADRELGTHLDVERIMRLALDSALRRTGATGGVVMLVAPGGDGLVPSVKLGRVNPRLMAHSPDDPLPLTGGGIGRAVRSGVTQAVRREDRDPDAGLVAAQAQALLVVPLRMRGEVLGVLSLAFERPDVLAEHDVSFLERLAQRAAVALDNARLYRQTRQLAEDMSVLYTASRAITSTLDRGEVLERIAEAMVMALGCSSAVMFDYRAETDSVQVLAVHQVGEATEAQEILPPVQHTLSVEAFPAFATAIRQRRPLVLRAVDPAIAKGDRAHLIADRIHAMIVLPLVAQEELMGVAVVIEGRHDRVFAREEIFKAETLASQAASALRQAMLYGEVLELERLKTEMIRMASHDLRNPLSNLTGYVELLIASLGEDALTPDQQLYVNSLRRSLHTMSSLLEDLLTLERIESERQKHWERLDLVGLISKVVDEQRASAQLQHQTLSWDHPAEPVWVFGSPTQLRQAVVNLVGNAIKYTPEGGRISVTLEQEGGRAHVRVQDNGYGISPERQARIFERFYRAREAKTDHISGTGLGLSLVKAVVEKHAGEVWFHSVLDEGSTFGFWIPVTE